MEINTKMLREELTKMASLVESVLGHCLDDNFSLEQLIELEKKVDHYHTDVDDHVFKFIALKAPTARDLREALAIMKINTDLERMSDQAVVIRRFWDTFETSYKDVFRMRDDVIVMVKNCIDSFVRHDLALAHQTISDDSHINTLNKELAQRFIEFMKNEQISFEEGFAVIRVIKNLERIADLATNISEDVIFLESGADIRHQGQRNNHIPQDSD